MSSDNPDITLGPLGGQWFYTRATKTYDLTRSAGSKVVRMATSHGPSGTQIEIDPSRTALVIVDMQNFFLDKRCIDHPTGLAAVKPLLTSIKRARELGIEIIWLNWGLTDADLASMPAGVLRGFANAHIAAAARSSGLGADLGPGLGRTLVRGEPNTAIWPPLAAAVNGEHDVHCDKNRMSGMWTPSQPLYRHLEKSGKTCLLFAGVNSDECVCGTLVDAYNAGWDCAILEDCCATTTPAGHEVLVYNVENYYGFVVNSQTFAESKLL
ncbi:isochorismatase [Xylariaceae sp. FL0016]|nr:isochorismatase [Xylariaceae sp. FL0016]